MPSDSLYVALVICCAMCPARLQKPSVSIMLGPRLQAGTARSQACYHVPRPLTVPHPLSSLAVEARPAGRVGVGRGGMHYPPCRRLRAKPDPWVWAAWGSVAWHGGMAWQCGMAGMVAWRGWWALSVAGPSLPATGSLAE